MSDSGHYFLRGGTLVDGSGGPSRKADVAVHDGRIRAVGEVDDQPGAREVGLTGLVRAPGFIDLDMHYDGQECWELSLTTS